MTKINDLISRLRDSSTDFSFGRQLATALQWGDAGSRVGDVRVKDFSADVTHGLLGDEVAVVFISTRDEEVGVVLGDAALYTYHTSAEWGVIADSEKIVIFNSRLLRRQYWYHVNIALDAVEPGSLEERLLAALSPDGISEGNALTVSFALDENRALPAPEAILQPVDDALVDRLDSWRRESLRFATDIEDFDSKLQTLFAQLFILRAVEDRSLAPSLPSLESTLINARECDLEKLRELFSLAQSEIASELFSSSVVDIIPEFVLGGIIHDLYYPYQLFNLQAKYNFSWIDTEVIGRAYQKYLSTILLPLELNPQMHLFDQPLREAKLVTAQKKSGVYYTPTFLVRYLTERTIDDQDSAPFTPELTNIPRVVDVSCGSGAFLTAAADALLRRLHEISPGRSWSNEIIKNKCIVGIDTDPRAATLAKLALWLRLAEEPDPLPLPSLDGVVIVGDALLEETWREVPGSFDVIVGNPPFLALGDIPGREVLAQRFESAQGRFDYSYLFVEVAISKLKPGGTLGLVVPNRMFKNRDARALRGVVTRQCDVLCIADFTSTPVFARTGVYVGTLRARRRRDDGDPVREKDPLRYIRFSSLPERFVNSRLMAADLSVAELIKSQFIAFNAPQPVGDGPWLFFSPSAQRARLRIEEVSVPLESLAVVRQGIKTGANDVFIVNSLQDNGSVAKIINGFSDTNFVETALLKPLASGVDLRRYDRILKTEAYLIYPYTIDGLIPEPILREQYPYTFRYLSQYRTVLGNRSQVLNEGKKWYELSRPRDQDWLERPKLLSRDLAQKMSFALDESGISYCVGGLAVIPDDSELIWPLLAYLNSEVMTWYLSFQAATFRGNFFKFEPQHIAALPIIPDVFQEGETRDLLEDHCRQILSAVKSNDEGMSRGIEREIDEILCRTIGISLLEIRA